MRGRGCVDDYGEATVGIGKRCHRDISHGVDSRTPARRRLASLTRGLVGEAEAGRGERCVRSTHEPQIRAHAELPGDLLHAALPVGEDPAAATGERHEQVAAALRPRERRPEFALDRPAAERGAQTPLTDGDDHVGINQRPGEVERPAGLVGGQVGGGRLNGGIKDLRIRDERTSGRCAR